MGIPKLFRKKITNVTPVGHPRLDEYFTEIKNENIWREKEKIKIIYAPHHSFEKRSLKFGTFAWSGKKILELAKKYSNEATFILKPHPRFDYAILSNNIMTEDELNSFYKEWQVCGEIYDQGDYFDLFRTSDALITDCVSFLAEYLPTKKPIIQLKRKDSMKFNSFGKAISKDFYGCYNEKELDDVFEEVIINKNDFLKEKRIKSAEEIFQFKSKVSKKIIAEIEKVLG
ncbi:MAG: CDP-glycerol glycerophosphotransferase family protein [Candidatus Gastranaerophilales bacterium]